MGRPAARPQPPGPSERTLAPASKGKKPQPGAAVLQQLAQQKTAAAQLSTAVAAQPAEAQQPRYSAATAQVLCWLLVRLLHAQLSCTSSVDALSESSAAATD